MIRARKLALMLFVLLNLGDLLLSCFLFSAHSEWARESNPVANWFLTHLGFVGLIGFKVVVVSFALFVLSCLHRSRPKVALATLWGGSAIVLAVVAYSLTLVRDLGQFSHEVAHQHERRSILARRSLKTRYLQKVLSELTRETVHRGLSLNKAVTILEKRTRQDKEWRKHLRTTFGPATSREHLAFVLCLHLGSYLPQESEQAQQIMLRVNDELTLLYVESADLRCWHRFLRQHWEPLLQQHQCEPLTIPVVSFPDH